MSSKTPDIYVLEMYNGSKIRETPKDALVKMAVDESDEDSAGEKESGTIEADTSKSYSEYETAFKVSRD